MKIAIYLYDGVTALDAVGPYESLQRIPQAEIRFVGKRRGEVRTGDAFLGLSVDRSLGEVAAADVLILPGGHGRSIVEGLGDQELLAWIRQIDAASRWTCSVCSGSLFLGAAGLLGGRRATTHWRAQAALRQFGATYSGERVTVDGKYMTSAGVSAGLDMGLVLCGELAGRAVAEAIELSLQYDPQPPFGTGNPDRSATPERVRLIEERLRAIV